MVAMSTLGITCDTVDRRECDWDVTGRRAADGARQSQPYHRHPVDTTIDHRATCDSAGKQALYSGSGW